MMAFSGGFVGSVSGVRDMGGRVLDSSPFLSHIYTQAEWISMSVFGCIVELTG